MKQNLITFFKKFWWWNILIDLVVYTVSYIFFVIQITHNPKLTNLEHLRIQLFMLVLVILHILFLLFSLIKRVISKKWTIAIILGVHISILIYVCRLILIPITLSIGFTGAD